MEKVLIHTQIKIHIQVGGCLVKNMGKAHTLIIKQELS
jgi:hypothetical protein